MILVANLLVNIQRGGLTQWPRSVDSGSDWLHSNPTPFLAVDPGQDPSSLWTMVSSLQHSGAAYRTCWLGVRGALTEIGAIGAPWMWAILGTHHRLRLSPCGHCAGSWESLPDGMHLLTWHRTEFDLLEAWESVGHATLSAVCHTQPTWPLKLGWSNCNGTITLLLGKRYLGSSFSDKADSQGLAMLSSLRPRGLLTPVTEVKDR